MEEKGIYGVWLFDEKIKELEEHLNGAWEVAERLDEKCDKLEEENERLKKLLSEKEDSYKRAVDCNNYYIGRNIDASFIMRGYENLLNKLKELNEKTVKWLRGE